MTAPYDRIAARLAELDELVATLRRDHAAMVAASLDSNADDEHDPEGATIAWEREQITALLSRTEAERATLLAAADRVADATYGICERCGRQIPPARLEVRPGATTCVRCA